MTVPFFLDNQLRQQLKYLVDEGIDVTAVASLEGDWSRLQAVEGLKCIPIDIARAPSPIKDFISLVNLYKFFKENRFDIVHSATPKAGLLCAIAAKLAGVPSRVHTFTGQVWANKSGPARWVYRLIDILITKLNTQCYADSKGQKQYLISEGVGQESSIKVIGAGSLAGVDLDRFDNGHWQQESMFRDLNIKKTDFIVTFIGRLSRDKGINELVSAFDALQKKYKHLHLLLIGPCEEKTTEINLRQWINIERLHYLGTKKNPEQYLNVSSLLCLPSYREGFGTVVIEAAAMKVPTLGSNIYGLTDAIQHEVTGILVEPQNTVKLQEALEKLVINEEYCKDLGEKAFERCRKEFDTTLVSQLLHQEYRLLMNKSKS